MATTQQLGDHEPGKPIYYHDLGECPIPAFGGRLSVAQTATWEIRDSSGDLVRLSRGSTESWAAHDAWERDQHNPEAAPHSVHYRTWTPDETPTPAKQVWTDEQDWAVEISVAGKKIVLGSESAFTKESGLWSETVDADRHESAVEAVCELTGNVVVPSESDDPEPDEIRGEDQSGLSQFGTSEKTEVSESESDT